MRGPSRPHVRAGAKISAPNEADASTYSIPAPYNGWNARGNLANMGPLDAIVMDNIFPGVQEVALRPGSVTWGTGFAANVKSLMTYNGKTTSKLFASTDVGIYDVTAAGAIGAAVAACTNGSWNTVNFATAGGSYLSMVNGVDNLKLYDGATWTTITAVSVPAITGLATTSLAYVTLHKKRQWFIEANSMNLWYLPVDSISGALTQFPVGSLFKQGGKLAAIGSWTLDGGSGSDDYFVIVTTKGEIAVYQGTDPASSTTWALVGVYNTSPPVGSLPLLDFGGDLLYLTAGGLVPLSKLVQSTVLDRSATVSYQIDGAMLDAVQEYAGNSGWQMVLHKQASALLVNIPVATDSLSYQFVMNTITKAWCRFTGWNARCWAFFNNEVYFGGQLAVYKAWTGTNDSGSPITGQVAQSYNKLGNGSQKGISLVRPNVAVAGSATLQMAIDTDFRVFNGASELTYSSGVSALWGTSLWGTGLWSVGLTLIEPKWTTVPNELGYLHSFRLQLTTSTASFTWTSTNYATRPAGIL